MLLLTLQIGNDKHQYQEMISKPSYLLVNDKNKDIFLNGEVMKFETKKVNKIVKKTALCLKALYIADYINPSNLSKDFASFK